jgi:two-component system chemotaxis response regulator CheY
MAKTVLVVDDVPFVRNTLKEILSAAHFQIVGEATDGEEAVDMYIKLKPDFVTMDVVMPNMSGIEATRAIIKLDKSARIFIVSAMGQENLVMEAINSGARDYILKPFSAAEILKTFERAVEEDLPASARARTANRESRTGG